MPLFPSTSSQSPGRRGGLCLYLEAFGIRGVATPSRKTIKVAQTYAHNQASADEPRPPWRPDETIITGSDQWFDLLRELPADAGLRMRRRPPPLAA